MVADVFSRPGSANPAENLFNTFFNILTQAIRVLDWRHLAVWSSSREMVLSPWDWILSEVHLAS